MLVLSAYNVIAAVVVASFSNCIQCITSLESTGSSRSGGGKHPIPERISPFCILKYFPKYFQYFIFTGYSAPSPEDDAHPPESNPGSAHV